MEYSIVDVNTQDLSPREGEHLYIVRNLKSAGIENNNRAMRNLCEWPEKIEAANRNGYYLESLSLLLQCLDLWLRIFVAAKTNKPVITKALFGNLIKQSRDLGLWSNLCDSLELFNSERIAAIHHYLLGGCAYTELVHVCVAARNLENTLPLSVLAQIAEPLREFPPGEDFWIVRLVSPMPLGNEQHSTNVKERMRLSREGKLKIDSRATMNKLGVV